MIISARMRKVRAVDTFRQVADAGIAPETVGNFLAELTYGLSNQIEAVSLDLEEQTVGSEEIVANRQRFPTGNPGHFRQAMAKMRRLITPQREAISCLAGVENWIIGANELALLR